MSPALRVAVLAGGLSHEREVSLRSGRRVADALRSAGCDVVVRDVDAGLLEFLSTDRPDVVFPVLHGASGEDGGVRDVLELLGLPYVGARPDACRRTFDKPVATSLVAAAGLSTPPSLALGHGAFRELGASAVLAAIVAAHGLPLVVKPTRGGSALGVTVVTDADALPRAMVDCFAYGDVALVQRAVTGREVAVSIVDTGSGPRALPAVEIVAAGGVYGYDARYSTGSTEYHAPARLSPAEASAVADAAVAAHTALGLRDVSRTDLIVDDAGTPWFLETNVAPGMTEVSLLPQALAAAKEEPGTVYRALVEQAATRS